MDEQLKYATMPEGDGLSSAIAQRPDLVAQAREELRQEYLNRHQEIAKANQDAANQIAANQRFADNIDVIAGVHTGIRKILRNSFNGLMTAMDSLNKATSENPDKEIPMPRWEDAAGVKEEKALGNPGKIAQTLTEVVAPMATGFAAPSIYTGLATATAVDILYGFLAQTPEDPNLSDMLKDTWVENIPAVATALEYTQHKPDDTEIEQRLKNAAVAGGLSAAVTGLIGGVTGLSRFFAGKKIAQSPETITALQKEAAAIEDGLKKQTLPAKEVPPATSTSKEASVPADANLLPIYHGTRGEHTGQLDPSRSGGMIFYAENSSDAMRYANGGGGGRASSDADSVVINNHNPDEFLTYDKGTNKWVGTWEGVHTEKDAIQVYALTHGDSEDAHIVFKSARVIPANYDPAKVLDITQNSDTLLPILEKLSPTNESAKRILNDTNVNAAFWNQSKYSSRVPEINTEMQEISNAIKEAGYTGIRFKDDSHITVALFEHPGVANIPHVGTPAEEAALSKLESTGYTSPDTPEEAALFKEQAKVLELDTPIVQANAEGQPFFKVQDSSFLNQLGEIAKANPESVLRRPMTNAQRAALATEASKDPNYILNLVKNYKAGTILNDVETNALQYALLNTDTEWQKYLQTLPEKLSEEQQLIFLQKNEGYLRMSDIVNGNASQQGAALEAQKVVASIYNSTETNGLAFMGAQGRAALATELKKKVKDVDKLAQGMKLISQIPDNQFTYRAGEIARKSKFERIESAVTKVALNGMTSLSFKSASVANALGTAKLSLDMYVQALNPLSKVTLEQANAAAVGMASSIKQGLKEGFNAGMNSGKVINRGQNMELIEAALNISSPEDVAVRAGLSSWSENGVRFIEKSADVLSAKGTPTKILVGLDAASNHIVISGLINAEAIKAADAAGIVGAERASFIEQFIKAPPAEVADKVDLTARTVSLSNDPAVYPPGFIGSKVNAAVSGVNDVLDLLPFNKVVFPFRRTAVNGIVMFADNSPFFALSPNFMHAVNQAKAGNAEALDLALTKAATGTLALTALMAAAHEGLISGGYKENPEVNKAVTGNEFPEETSIKIGGKWIKADGYGYISTLIDIASAMNRAASYMTVQEYDEAAAALLIAVSEQNTPLTKDISGLLSATDGEPLGLKWLQDIPLRAIPMGSAVRGVRDILDPKKREVKSLSNDALTNFKETFINKFMNRIPGLSSNLPVERNFFGEPIRIPYGLYSGAVSIFTASEEETQSANAATTKGAQIKNAMDQLTMFEDFHKDDPIPPEKIDFKKPLPQVPLFITNGLAPMATGLQYELTPFEYSAYQKLSGGVDPITDKPYPDAFGKALSLKDRFYEVLERNKVIGVPFSKMTRAQYSNVVTELRHETSLLRQSANNKIRQFEGVQDNMNMQRNRALQFKAQEGL